MRLLILILVIAAPAAAADDPDPYTLLTSLEGNWRGQLEYRDYQTNELAAIPMKVTVDRHGDILIRRLTFTDPGFQVRRVSVLTWDADARLAREAYIQDGKAEARTTAVSLLSHDDTAWAMTLETESFDDDRPAMLRETMKLQARTLTIVKEVDFLDDDEELWEFRNQVSLQRTPADQSF